MESNYKKLTAKITKLEKSKMKKEEKEMAQNSNPFGATFSANPDE